MRKENAGCHPEVSIIVPVYNVEKYLKQCLDSLVRQTLKEIEVICVNDGSTDGSLEILQEYACVDNRIIVLSQRNSGYGASMNRGISCAKGKYIGIVESDDFADESMFQKLYEKAQETSAQVVKSNYNIYCGAEEYYQENIKGIAYDTVFRPEEYPGIFSVAPSIWSGLYRADFLRNHEITFQETPGASYQDVSFFYLTLLYAERMVCVKDAFLNYRFDNAASSVHSTEKVYCIMSEFQRVWERYTREGETTLLAVIEAAKFIHYYDNYNRIDSLFQYAFLCEMSRELAEDEKKGLLQRKYWTDTDWERLLQIKEEPEHYFKSTNKEYINKYQLKGLTINASLKTEAIREAVRKSSKVILYGAGIYAEQIGREVERLHPVFAYAVTNPDKESRKELNGVRICGIEELMPYANEALIIVAVKKSSQPSIIVMLHEKGFGQILSVDGPTLEER